MTNGCLAITQRLLINLLSQKEGTSQKLQTPPLLGTNRRTTNNTRANTEKCTNHRQTFRRDDKKTTTISQILVSQFSSTCEPSKNCWKKVILKPQ